MPHRGRVEVGADDVAAVVNALRVRPERRVRLVERYERTVAENERVQILLEQACAVEADDVAVLVDGRGRRPVRRVRLRLIVV